MRFKKGKTLHLSETGGSYHCSPVEDPVWEDVWLYPRDEVIARAVMEVGAVSDEDEDRHGQLLKRNIRHLLVCNYMTREGREKLALSGSDYFQKTLNSMRDEIAALYLGD